jgi:glycosyltransferase involved in cell wall biosynthesis
MQQVSVVIITKNEASNIIDCIAAAKKISANIIVIDSGSTDATVALAKAENVKVYSITWEGYGHARNTGALLADNDWIFSLDADERITQDFVHSIKDIPFTDDRIVYGFKRLNYFGNKKIRYGSFAHDRVFRLYNRRNSKWNLAPIHEKLTGENLQRAMTPANIIHYAIRAESLYLQKISGYVILCALKYKQEKKRFIHVRSLFSPVFNFVQGYIFQLGFLDKRPGFTIAKINARHTRKKYRQLLVLMNEERKQSGRSIFLQNSLGKIISFLS